MNEAQDQAISEAITSLDEIQDLNTVSENNDKTQVQMNTELKKRKALKDASNGEARPTKISRTTTPNINPKKKQPKVSFEIISSYSLNWFNF